MANHSPKFSSDDEAHRFYIVCGKIALNWGPVESAIESLIILLRSRQDAPSDLPFPRSFSKKTDELKERLSAQPSLQSHEPLLTTLILEAKRLHSLRTLVVHGICQGTNRKGDMMFGIPEQKRGVAYAPKKIAYAKLEATAQGMTETASALIAAFNQARLDI